MIRDFKRTKEEVREIQAKIQELNRSEIASYESLGQAQTQLNELNQALEAEKQAWEREMKFHLKYEHERHKFQQFCAKQLMKGAALGDNKPATLNTRVAAHRIGKIVVMW